MNAIVEFNYAALDAETRIVVQQRTSEIKTLMRRTAQDILDIGEKLVEVKGRLGHGNFGGWLQAEFAWSERTARQFMQVYTQFKTANFADLNIAPSALYLLAAPSTPEEAREEVLELAQAGQPVGYTDAKRIISGHKPLPTNSHRSGVRANGDGAEPDLDEDGQPLRRRYVDEDDEDEDEELLRPRDVVRYGGQTFTLRSVASSGRVYFDVPKSHKLYGRGIESEDVVLIERRAERQPPRPTVQPGPTAEETAPHIDGVSVAVSHPAGWKMLFLEATKAECLNCGVKSARWSPVRGGDWRCEACKRLTHDDLLIAAEQTPPPPPARIQGGEKEIRVVDEMPINESHPVGYAGLYATDEAIGYGRATCPHCGELHNAWTAVKAGRWRCGKCLETTNDDAMRIVGKAEYDLEKRMATHRRNGNGHKPAPVAESSEDDADTLNDEWGTPDEWIVKARKFMGDIDTDPASNASAQKIIRAKLYYDKREDGLCNPWHGCVWLNPPYSYPLVERFTREALARYRRGEIKECLILVNNQTGAAWFQSLLVDAAAVLFVKGRISFIHPQKGDSSGGNRQAQALFYLGKRAADFVQAFSNDGIPMQCMWAREAVQS